MACRQLSGSVKGHLSLGPTPRQLRDSGVHSPGVRFTMHLLVNTGMWSGFPAISKAPCSATGMLPTPDATKASPLPSAGVIAVEVLTRPRTVNLKPVKKHWHSLENCAAMRRLSGSSNLKGNKNWLFSWTEIDAEPIAVVQSLLVTCKLQGADPYTYLVDVLQRISDHPASRVVELTPRMWKTLFADKPLKSDLALAQNKPARPPTIKEGAPDAISISGLLISLTSAPFRGSSPNSRVFTGDESISHQTTRYNKY